MNFTPVDNAGRVEGFCLIRTVECKSGKNGDYLDMTLCDKSGEINGKLWRYSVSEHGEYAANDLVKIRGVIRQFNGTDQLNVERIRPVTDNDGVNMEDFVKSSSYTGQQMYDELLSVAASFEEENLKILVTAILEDHRIPLLYWPAAFKLHHAMRGGLLLHTLSIVRLAQKVCEIYPFIDKDLLLAGAILHDISKIEEFIVPDTGVAEGYSVEGNLIGHLALGAIKISKYAEKLGIDDNTAMLLEHMVLSHHGEPEFGAAVRPMFMEAELLSELDLMDARVFEMQQAVAGTKPNDFSQRLWALDNRKLYHHARKEIDAEPKLF